MSGAKLGSEGPAVSTLVVVVTPEPQVKRSRVGSSLWDFGEGGGERGRRQFGERLDLVRACTILCRNRRLEGSQRNQ